MFSGFRFSSRIFLMNDEIAEEAIRKRRRLLHLKVLELVLGDLVRDEGVKKTQALLVWYARRLRDF